MNQHQVVVPLTNVIVTGVLTEAEQERAACAVLVRGAGSETRDARVTEELAKAGVATLAVDLLTKDEQQFDSRTGHFRYDADFLAHRVIGVAQWLQRNTGARDLPVAFIGSAAGAAAVLVAAALRPDLPSAVVAVNGRTDLAADYLRSVKTPTLFILNDMPVLRMNRDALSQIRGEKRIEVLHAEDGEALEHFVQKAVRWVTEKAAVELV
jgi:putative phosphoribosyl transferase